MEYEEIKKHIVENVDQVYFSVEFTCTLGDTYMNAGESYKFVQYRDLIISEAGVLSIIPDRERYKNSYIYKVLDLFDLEFLSLSHDEVGHVREFYAIKGIIEEESP